MYNYDEANQLSAADYETDYYADKAATDIWKEYGLSWSRIDNYNGKVERSMAHLGHPSHPETKTICGTQVPDDVELDSAEWGTRVCKHCQKKADRLGVDGFLDLGD